MIALDTADGTIQWQTTAKKGQVTPLTALPEDVVVPDGPAITVVNAGDGSRAYTIPIASEGSVSGVAVTEGRAYLGVWNGGSRFTLHKVGNQG